MSVKGKGKADDAASVTSDNGSEGVLISATIIIVIELKKDILIKVRESAVFIGD
jgi:hypothetical protein